MQMLTLTHALHNVRRRLVQNMERFSLDNDDLVSDATTPQCQAEHALMIRS